MVYYFVLYLRGTHEADGAIHCVLLAVSVHDPLFHQCPFLKRFPSVFRPKILSTSLSPVEHLVLLLMMSAMSNSYSVVISKSVCSDYNYTHTDE